MFWNTKAPKKYISTATKLNQLLFQYQIDKYLSSLTGRTWKYKRLRIVHRPLGLGAAWKSGGIIEIDFSNPPKYCWLSVAHEAAHLLLRQKPAWDQGPAMIYALKEHSSYKPRKYKYTFPEAIEQVIATFLQAACEQRAGIRSLDYRQWRQTFSAFGIETIARKWWPTWKTYIVSGRPKSIEQWILARLHLV